MSPTPTPDPVPSASSSPSPPGVSSSTPSSRSRSNRSRNNRSNNQRNVPAQNQKKIKFKGETDALKGNIFSTPEESQDATQYIRTLEALQRYCSTHFDSDFSSIFNNSPNNSAPSVDIPVKPESSATELEKDLYPLRLKAYVSQEIKLVKELQALWSVIWGQCTVTLITKLEDNDDIETWHSKGDVVSLLNEIQQISFKFDRKASPFITLHKHMHFFYSYRQKDNDDIHRYFELFKLMVDNIQRFGGAIGRHPLFIKESMKVTNVLAKDATDEEFGVTYDALTSIEKESYKRSADDRALAVAFLMGGKQNVYGDLLVDLQNQYLIGNDQFPVSLTAAYALMANYVPRSRPTTVVPGDQAARDRRSIYSLGMSFFQSTPDPASYRLGKGVGNKDDPVPGIDGVLFNDVRCFRCNYWGHYANKCGVAIPDSSAHVSPSSHETDDDTVTESIPSAKNKSDASSTGSKDSVGFSFMQQPISNGLDDLWILLDTQSSVDIFKSKRLLESIYQVEGPGLELLSNGNGIMHTNTMATLRGYGPVWFDERSMANILSFSNVRKKFPISISTGPNDPCPSILVHKKDGTTMCFKEYKMGLYVFDAGTSADNTYINHANKPSCHYSCLQTVESNLSLFTPREIKRANMARDLYRKIGRPSLADFVRYLDNNLIHNCSITSADAKRAHHIFGPDAAYLQGKTKRSRPNAAQLPPLLPVPIDIMQLHRNIHLCIDIFFINGVAFIHSISKHIQFRTIEPLQTVNYKALLNATNTIFNFYNARGFNIEYLHADHQFDCLRESIRPTVLYISAAGEHVPEVERSIQTIESNCRALYHALPFQLLPRIMTRSLVRHVVRTMNIFPSTTRVSTSMGPTTLLTGLPMPDVTYFSLEFGAYVHVHDHPDHTNDINPPRTTGAIALGPANQNNGWHFMSLTTGARLLRYKWTCLPVPHDVVTRVHALALREMSLKNKKKYETLVFERAPDVPFISALEGAQDDVSGETLNNDLGFDHLSASTNPDEVHINDLVLDNPTIDMLVPIAEAPDPNTILHDPHSDVLNNNHLELDTSINQSQDMETPVATQLSEELHSLVEDLSTIESNFHQDANEVNSMLNAITNQPDTDHEPRSEDADTVNETMSEPTHEESNDSDTVQESRSDPLSSNQNEVRYNLRSNTNPVPLINEEPRYNLRSHRNDTASSTFNSNTYNFLQYSFLQFAQDAANSVTSIVDNINESWIARNATELGVNSSHSGSPTATTKNHCIKIVTKELQRLSKGQHFHRGRLHRNLIQLCHMLLSEHNDEATVQGKGAICLTQMSARKGIEIFGERALQAMIAEYEQLDNLNVFTPVDAALLTWEQKKNALNALDLIKEKRSGKIKGRTVADGRKQRPFYSKSDVYSPALSQDGFFVSLAIDALERRFVATADVAGAFLKAKMDDVVIVRIQGPAVDALLRINREKYEKFVVIEKNKQVLYVHLLKAMYGTLTAPILWYKLFSSTLTSMGFEINPYDLCVANKMVDGSQMTICWYVDDLKVSHINPEEVKKVIHSLEKEFGKMNVNYGSDHTYLGMDLHIEDGEVEVSMPEYLKECITSFGEPINSVAKSPATRNLMMVDPESPVLSTTKSDTFHHIVAKLLHVAKRARLDIEPTVTFLCRRVKCPTFEDWSKLKRLLQYIHGSITLKRKLSIKNFGDMSIYVDAAHATHNDARGQTGACITMGNGVIHSKSTRQSINTKSSTETELVGASDYLPFAIWMIYFMRSQGYEIKKKTFFQDNQSTIKMISNGRKPAGKQSRHISIRYFWISDRIKKECIDVEYCPTGLMLGDFFTKPLQGSLFRKMRDVVQGMAPITVLKPMPAIVDGKSGDKEPAVKEIKSDISEVNTNIESSVSDNKERVAENKRVANNKRVTFSADCLSTQSNVEKKYDGKNTKDYYPTYSNVVKLRCT